MKLHRDLGITQKSAWHFAHRLQEAWDSKKGCLFGDPVEVDETYVGGRRVTSASPSAQTSAAAHWAKPPL